MAAHRSPARWLAPLALIASLVAVLLLVTSTLGGGEGEPAAPAGGAAREEQAGGDAPARTGEDADAPAEGDGEPGTDTATAAQSGPRTYRVRTGDTLGAIAERTGVPVERLNELNPDLDPQTLTVGQTIRLRGGE